MLFKVLSIACLMPLIGYDLLTSVGGGFSVFNVNYQTASWVVLAFPIALALGTITLNLWTVHIFSLSGPAVILQIFWLVAFSYDCYTTFLGVIGFMSGGGFLYFPHNSIWEATRSLDLERIAVALGAAVFVVISPMTANIIFTEPGKRFSNSNDSNSD